MIKESRWKVLFNKWMAPMSTRLHAASRVLREFFYGMSVYEINLEMKRERRNLHRLFMLVTFGDLVGLPLLPSYYSMRLFPYVIPAIESWKRSLLREKDLTELGAVDI